jgi:Uma2 family endonuclease
MVREPIPEYANKEVSIEEYLAFERSSQEKHEYYKGEVFAMSGAGRRHNIIFSNLFGELGFKLKGKPCFPYVVTCACISPKTPYSPIRISLFIVET